MLDYWICRKQLDFNSKAILAFDEFLVEACTSETDLPYNKGMMYVVPREPFTSQSGIEWATSESVKPLVRLPIDPKDFPYLDFVKGVEPEPMIQRVQSGIEGYPWIDDPEIFPVAPEIPLDKRASQFGIVKLGNLD